MSAVITEPVAALPNRDEPSRFVVQRRAFHLTSQGQPLFAWLHARQDGPNVDHGVVICPPIGHEQLHSHRTLRHLADALARHGIPTLRFDWHGTGDSAGVDEDGARTATWQANIRDALEWMRHDLGCRQVSVIGLRIGATLAALASEDHDIDNLVLWAPVTNGRAYVREMKAIDLTSESRPASKPEDSGDIEAAGFVLSKLAAAELSLVNLLKSHPRCRHGLVVMRDDIPADYRLLDRCSDLGFPVEQITVPGFAEMLAEPHRGEIPQRAIHEISTWLRQQIDTFVVPPLGGRFAWGEGPPEGGTTNGEGPPEGGTTNGGTKNDRGFVSTLQPRPPERLRVTGFRERTLEISPSPHLFGIISEPVTGATDDRPTIVLLNSGSTHRVGPGRLHVHLARRLAENGFRCLRMDISGLGDSITPDIERENESYPATVFRDVQLTLNRLRDEYGVKPCVLMGLCSGAYGAFQSAACIPDPTLVESILINPLTFFWKEGMSVDTAPVRELMAQHHYLSSALQPKKWLKLLSGRSQIGVVGALRLVAQRLYSNKSVSKANQREPLNGSAPRTLSHPLHDDLPTDLASISAAGRTLAMFFAASDPGYSILMHKAKRQAEQLCRDGELKIAFIKDADHTFSRRGPRRELIEMLLTHLRQRFPIEM